MFFLFVTRIELHRIQVTFPYIFCLLQRYLPGMLIHRGQRKEKEEPDRLELYLLLHIWNGGNTA